MDQITPSVKAVTNTDKRILPVALLLSGCLLCATSVIAFGTAIYHGFTTNKQYVDHFWIGVEHSTPIVTVNTEHFTQLAVKLTVNSDALKKERGKEKESIQYNFPIRYHIMDHDNNILHEEITEIGWDKGSRKSSNKTVGINKGKLTVEADFEKVKIPSPGKIQIVVHLDEDDLYEATASEVELIIYDDVRKHTSLVLTGIIAMVAGLISLFFGLICLANRSALTQKQMQTGETQPALQADKNWAMAVHLSSFSGYLIPFGGLIGPLAIWLAKRGQHPFINNHGKEAVNFRISLFIYFTLAFILCFILIGFLLLFLLWLMDIILTIIAAIKASDGEEYRYPLSIRFVK